MNSTLPRLFHACLKSTCQTVRKVSTSQFIHRRFIDQVRLHVRGGTGGNGCKSIGCVGGDGGNVVIIGREHASLGNFKSKENRRIVAGHGKSCKLRGRNRIYPGQDVLVKVPCGTILKSEEGKPLFDLNDNNQSYIAARGGKGGSALTDNFQGRVGERQIMILELKMISDIGMVGFPNAGKSTLLSKISRAAPKVANYPFTTINPTVGIVHDSHSRSKFSVADLPGLIEGAHLNRGMGHKFLRHAERTSVILMMVDLCGFQLKENAIARDPFEMICLLMKELFLYQPEMLSRPLVIALNKMDAVESSNIQMLKDKLKNCTVGEITSICSESALGIHKQLKCVIAEDFSNIIPISAHHEIGLDDLKIRLRQLLQEHNMRSDDNEATRSHSESSRDNR